MGTSKQENNVNLLMYVSLCTLKTIISWHIFGVIICNYLYNVNTNPLYINHGIICDVIKIQNCLFVHDYLNNSMPSCFEDHYFKLNHLYLNVQTISANLGCLFFPSKNTTRYGLNSISQTSVTCWNTITKIIKTDISNVSRHQLKNIFHREISVTNRLGLHTTISNPHKLGSHLFPFPLNVLCLYYFLLVLC